MPTAYMLIRRSLRLCGVLDPMEAVPAADAQDGLESLNAMLGSWRLENLLVYDIERAVFNLVGGQQTYTLGPGGNWDTTALFGAQTPRPVKVDAMGLIDATQTPALEVPMEALSQVEYQQVHLKALQSSWPTRFMYSATVPLGSVFLWPAPTVAYQVAAYLWRSLTQWPTVQTDLTLPDGAEDAIVYNLARRMAPEYGVQLLPDVIGAAIETKALVMRNNCVSLEMDLDPRVPGVSTNYGSFNYITGDVI